MVARTSEFITSLDHFSKRASIYIDPETDLYAELCHLRSREEDLHKCFPIIKKGNV